MVTKGFVGAVSPHIKWSMTAFFVALAALVPVVSHAAGGAGVELQFTEQTKLYLWISLGFGLLSLLSAWFVARMALRVPPGSERMQEISRAIREGALAYLLRQVKTMAVFVVLLGILLYAIFQGQFGSFVALLISISFLGGVTASYLAGYSGMLMAVNGNARTANAALTSYKRAIETAFRSGAVAGLVTVGMGLIGATLIILFAPKDATKLLIGFGFGGSLAALFMRVGGGIYTKAADVGADLVGKVEAGIPEDDPRNPATIADNVGDNVGDCAGMAADVFESYEVTLVAAIVLGAATSVIFPTQTWMQLILFALMARGVGIIASIFGIFSMKGTDDLQREPLSLIRGGFYRSAALAILLTLGLAYLMVGGTGQNLITTSQVTAVQDQILDQIQVVQSVARRVAARQGVEIWQVKPEDVQKEPELVAMKLDGEEVRPQVQSMMNARPANLPSPLALSGFQLVDLNNPPAAIRDYSFQDIQAANPAAPYRNLIDWLKENEFLLYEVKVTQKIPAVPASEGRPAQPERTQSFERAFGMSKGTFEQFRQQVTMDPNTTLEVIGEPRPIRLYASKDGRLAMAVDGPIASPVRVQVDIPQYFRQSASRMNELFGQLRNTPPGEIPTVTLPPAEEITMATVKHTTAPWWKFALCVIFGIVMAIAIEWLTDYYVSPRKKPVREVATVATAGPAPMIIQGFALGKESSVFSVFAIVILLITPLLVFPPDLYGGYLLSFYGIALVGLGLLTTTGYILAMDTFGPISDNAQGVYEMSGEGHGNPTGMRIVQHLDAAGNTTKALTKGFAIATAVVAAVALFHSFVEDARLTELGLRIELPEIFLGLLIGGAAPYLFSAFSINAVGRAAFELINEVRRQFASDPGIMAGSSKPDYGRCVAIVTAAAQKELLGPGILAIALPTAVAFGFAIGKPTTFIGGQEYNLVGAQALGGFLAGAILSGQLMAVLLANSGGIWDNAKKLIEDGLHGGKGTDAHKAGVVCDTVGDPFKDTSGPAMNPLIKVMNLVALLLVPVVIQPYPNSILIAVTAACIVLLIVSFWWSKRSSIGSEMAAVSAAAAAPEKIEPEQPPVLEDVPSTPLPPDGRAESATLAEEPQEERERP